MAYTERVLDTDNTQGPFAISFNYLAGSTIKVQLLDTLGNQVSQAFTFTGTPTESQPSGTAVLLDVAPPLGYKLRIYKDVSMDTLIVQWGVGSEFSQDNLRTTSTQLMEQAQLAYDISFKAFSSASEALNATTDVPVQLAQAIADVNAITDAAVTSTSQAVIDAQFWADVAEAAGGISNPAGTAEVARDAAIAAKIAAEAARDLSIAAKDLAQSASTLVATQATQAVTSATLAEDYANKAKGSAVVAGKFSAKHYAETAQDIVNAGALRWNGSAKFVATTDPDPAQGVNGDFWFKREV